MRTSFSQSRWDTLPGLRSDLNNQQVYFYENVLFGDSNYLYLGGMFQIIGSEYLSGIARWNGVKWDSMGAGINGLSGKDTSCLSCPPPGTSALITYHNKLYYAGGCSSLGNVKAGGFGTWNGTNWDTISIQPFTAYDGGGISTFAVINNKLICAGLFDTIAGQVGVYNIAAWNDTTWSSLNFPYIGNDDQGIYCVCEYKGNIIVAGDFYGIINGDTLSQMAQYDGKKWLPVGQGIVGVYDQPTCMVVYDSDLYVAGLFSKADGNYGDNIQRWNGTSWSEVGGGLNYGTEFQLLIYHDKLCVIGGFSTAGGVPAQFIALWDGSQWCGLGSTFNRPVGNAWVYKDTLYIAGTFTKIDNDTIAYIAKWIGGDYVDTCGNDGTGINELNGEIGELNVYPNPSQGVFTFSLTNENETSNIEIYNMIGEKVFTETLPQMQNNNTIDITGQPSGIYLYRVIQEDGKLIGTGKLLLNDLR